MDQMRRLMRTHFCFRSLWVAKIHHLVQQLVAEGKHTYTWVDAYSHGMRETYVVTHVMLDVQVIVDC